jgi:hypothetical protein
MRLSGGLRYRNAPTSTRMTVSSRSGLKITFPRISPSPSLCRSRCVFVDLADPRATSFDGQLIVVAISKRVSLSRATTSSTDGRNTLSVARKSHSGRADGSELVFQPLKAWIFKGPITPLFHQFIWSSIPLHSKFTICGYIFSYYAIACSWILTVANFFLIGLDCEFSCWPS